MPPFFRGICRVAFALAFGTSVAADDLNARITAAYDAGTLPGLHASIVRLGDETLSEVYFPGPDERWGQPIGLRDHGPDTLHDLRSVTKSVVGLLYGIALADGVVPALDKSLYAQFPQYPDLQNEPGRELITVGHTLSMQMGLSWNEDLPYSDPRNSEIAMERAEDRYRFVLEQPIQTPPGQGWTYSGGAVALIGKLIADGTGQALDQFAKNRLFTPLGITRFEWVGGAAGIPSAASGLRLTLPDLAKIGQLVAQDGQWDGAQIIPADWLARSAKPRVRLNQFTQYGYLWYLSGPPTSPVMIAVGNGGQRLSVQAEFDLVTATYAGLYNNPDSWRTSLSVFLDFAVPEAQSRLRR